MEPGATILSIATAATLGAISPGPSFLMVAHTSLSLSCQDGLATVVGMGAVAPSSPFWRFGACLSFSPPTRFCIGVMTESNST